MSKYQLLEVAIFQGLFLVYFILLNPRGLYDLNKEESVIQPITKSTESVSKSETAEDTNDSSSFYS